MPNVNYVSSSPTVRVSRARDAHGVTRVPLFKVDHPRAIDRHIDFFGTSTTVRSSDVSCGESLIDSLLERECA
jgi:hypothetical protein